MEGTLVLCDYAEAINGKLYLHGGGWNQAPAMQPLPVSLGVILQVPWDQTNIEHALAVDLFNEDGEPVLIGDPPTSIRQGGPFEVGRPPGVPRGTSLPVVLAIRWPILPLPVGAFAFTLQVDNREIARVSFRAVAVQEADHG